RMADSWSCALSPVHIKMQFGRASNSANRKELLMKTAGLSRTFHWILKMLVGRTKPLFVSTRKAERAALRGSFRDPSASTCPGVCRLPFQKSSKLRRRKSVESLSLEKFKHSLNRNTSWH